MVSISTIIGCRNCTMSTGIRNIYGILDGDFEKYKKKSELEVALFLEENMVEKRNQVCDFCGSNNLEFSDIEVNDYRLYDFDRIVERCNNAFGSILIVVIDKTDNKIECSFGGNERYETLFLKKALLLLKNVLNHRPDKVFIPKDNGSFVICITMEDEHYSGIKHLKTQRLTSFGITKSEIFEVIDPLLDQLKDY